MGSSGMGRDDTSRDGRGAKDDRRHGKQPDGVEDSAPLLGPLIELAEAQLAAMISRGENLDSQALAVVAFDGALIAVAVAAFGCRWWIPVLGLAFSIVAGALVLAVQDFEVGPSAGAFFALNQDKPERDALELLLSDLLDSQRRNARPLRTKTVRLVASVALLGATIAYSAPVLAL